MNKFFIKKIILGIILVTVFLSSFLITFPQKAQAQTPVSDIANTIQGAINAVNTGFISYTSNSNWLKEYVLDPLAYMLAKQIIRQLTTSIVTWINSGFEGSPSFLQNPGSFFLDVADQMTGEFLAKHGGPLTDLCSPFSIDIRLALAFKYHPNIPKRYECTLGKIIKNTKNAVEGASINGFTAGDFKQGGWPAFVSLTTEPQNNAYGAYLTAESELSLRVANAQVQKRDELGAGKGFLSWRDPKCKADVRTHNDQVAKDFEALNDARSDNFSAVNDEITTRNTYENLEALNDGVPGETFEQTSKRIGGDVTQSNLRSLDDCPIQTPGSVIVDQLNDSIKGPMEELRLADEINEIVNALFAQLVTQVLQKGLGAVSGSGPGDSTSYITSIQNEAAASNNTANVEEIRSNLLSNMATYISNTNQYKANKEASYGAVVLTKGEYDKARSCYQTKINTPGELDGSEISEAQVRIGEIDALIISKVAVLAAKQSSGVTEASDRLKILTNIQSAATTAKTINDLNIPSQQYSLLVQQQRLTNAKDIVDSQTELDSIKSQTQSMNEEAGRLLQACELFPHIRR